MPAADSAVDVTRDKRPDDVSADVQLDRRLVSRIKNGETDALGELYDRYASLALGVALRVVGDRDLGEDVVHDAFVAVWRKIQLFDADRGSVRSWLLTIVRNRAIDRMRAKRPMMDVDDADEQALLRTAADPTLTEVLQRIGSHELRTAVARLPAAQREAVELAYFGGHTYREIAKLQRVPTGTASGRLRLALGKLRAMLQRPDDSTAAPRNLASIDE